MGMRANIAVARQCFETGTHVEERVLALARSTGLPESMARRFLMESIDMLVIHICSDIIAYNEGQTSD